MQKICNTLEVIEAIKKYSDMIYKGNSVEVLKLPHYAGYILIRLSKYADGSYYDIFECQRHDIWTAVEPTHWAMVKPQEFYDDVLIDYLQGETTDAKIISYRELKKTKAKKICYKSTNYAWIDSNNFFYFSKFSIPNKNAIENYKKLVENSSTAVKVRYFNGDTFCMKYIIDWFINIEDAKKEFEINCNGNLKTCFPSDFKVLKTGYDELHPLDRKYVLVFPYFNLQRELKKYHIINCAMTWLNMINDEKISIDISSMEEIIKSYQKYLEKQMKVSDNTDG